MTETNLKSMTPDEAIKYATKVDNPDVWKEVLERIDVQEFLREMPSDKAYNYALKNHTNWRIWKILLDRVDVQECLN
jgi:hypothetical protein